MSYFLIIIISFYVINYVTNFVLEKDFIDDTKNELKKNSNMISVVVSEYLYNDEIAYINNLVKDFSGEIDGRILILDNRGVVISDAFNQIELANRKLEHEEILYALNGANTAQKHYIPVIKNGENSHQWVMYSAAPIYYRSEIIGVTFLSTSIQQFYDSLGMIKWRLNIYSLVISILVAVFSLYISGYITDPLNKITEVIRNMGQGHLNQRVEIKGNNELAELGNAFNSMSERLENLDKAREEFVANASHELKTPLSSMKVLVESLIHQPGGDIEIFKEFLKDVNSEIDRLTAIINDLLVLVQIDKKDMELKKTQVNIEDVLSYTIKRLQPIARKKNIEISFLSDYKGTIDVDKLKIQQVSLNLVDNAIKYTPDDGEVNIRLTSDNDYVIFMISDTGIGIPEEDKKLIFERFYRVDKARARGTGGTGLGLSIVSRIVRLHQGEIFVESEPGKGTTFTVKLPKNGQV